jgi:hypothetical protein
MNAIGLPSMSMRKAAPGPLSLSRPSGKRPRGLGYLALERHVPLRYTHHTTTIPQIPRCISNASRGPHRLSTFLLYFYHLLSNTGTQSVNQSSEQNCHASVQRYPPIQTTYTHHA